MYEFFLWSISVFVYSLIGGITYKVAAIKLNATGDEHPGVFFSGVLWPIVLPAGLGTSIVSAMSSQSRMSRAKRRQEQEIIEAKHKKELARINAETLEINERAALR